MRNLTKTLAIVAVFAAAGNMQVAKAADLWVPEAEAAPGAYVGPPAAGEDYYGPVASEEYYAPAYYPPAYRGYSYYYGGYDDRGYRQVPYGYSSSPNYYDEVCHVITEPTPYGWRRLRVCE